MTILSDVRPEFLINTAGHTIWCSHHVDGGTTDQECTSAPWRLIPETSVSTDPSHVRAQLVEHFERSGDQWQAEPPAVVLTVDNPAGAELTTAEALALAEELLRLVAVAQIGELA